MFRMSRIVALSLPSQTRQIRYTLNIDELYGTQRPLGIMNKTKCPASNMLNREPRASMTIGDSPHLGGNSLYLTAACHDFPFNDATHPFD